MQAAKQHNELYFDSGKDESQTEWKLNLGITSVRKPEILVESHYQMHQKLTIKVVEAGQKGTWQTWCDEVKGSECPVKEATIWVSSGEKWAATWSNEGWVNEPHKSWSNREPRDRKSSCCRRATSSCRAPRPAMISATPKLPAGPDPCQRWALLRCPERQPREGLANIASIEEYQEIAMFFSLGHKLCFQDIMFALDKACWEDAANQIPFSKKFELYRCEDNGRREGLGGCWKNT